MTRMARLAGRLAALLDGAFAPFEANNLELGAMRCAARMDSRTWLSRHGGAAWGLARTACQERSTYDGSGV